jgi:hypothetical protein
MNLQLVSFPIASLFAAPLTSNHRAQQLTADEAEVSGTVTAANGAFLNHAPLLFTSGDRRIVTRTGDKGDYTIRLTPGIYTVSVRIDGFCESRRGSFSLKSGARVIFDFELPFCATIDIFPGPEHRAEDPYPAGLPKVRQSGQYGEEELKAIGPAGLRPLIIYGDREENAASITYSPLVLHEFNDIRMPVVYSYDLLTIRCDHLIYFPKDNSIEASGKVVWQDGSETRRGSKLSLSFRDGEPIVSLTK